MTNSLPGDEEGPGQFDHSQFAYDREEDFARGISPRRHGGRGADTKNATKPENAAVARCKLGLVDTSFFPEDSCFAQREIRTFINKKENAAAGKGKGKKLKTKNQEEEGEAGENTEVDRFGDRVLKVVPIPEGYPKDKHSCTDKDRLDQATIYKIFLRNAEEHFVRARAYPHMRPGEQKLNDEEWDMLCVDMLETDTALPYQVRQDLLFGCYREETVQDIEANRDDDILNMELFCADVDKYVHALAAGDNTVPIPDAPDRATNTKVIRVKLDVIDQLWNQRRRFLWPAFRHVVRISFESSTQTREALDRYLKSRKEYSDYWGDEDYVKQLPMVPDHPHFIDIKINKKRKADDDDTEASDENSQALTTTKKAKKN